MRKHLILYNDPEYFENEYFINLKFTFNTLDLNGINLEIYTADNNIEIIYIKWNFKDPKILNNNIINIIKKCKEKYNSKIGFIIYNTQYLKESIQYVLRSLLDNNESTHIFLTKSIDKIIAPLKSRFFILKIIKLNEGNNKKLKIDKYDQHKFNIDSIKSNKIGDKNTKKLINYFDVIDSLKVFSNNSKINLKNGFWELLKK